MPFTSLPGAHLYQLSMAFREYPARDIERTLLHSLNVGQASQTVGQH